MEGDSADGDAAQATQDVGDPVGLPFDQLVEALTEGEGAGDEGEGAEEGDQRDEGEVGSDQSDDPEGKGGAEGTITLDVRKYMDYGLDVYDAERKRVGTVRAFESDAGYMIVQFNPLLDRFLYIPFSAITHIDPREAFVSGTREELHKAYADQPPCETVVQKRNDRDTGEDESTAITSKSSGYDGAPVVVDVSNIGQIAHHVAPGFHVYTSELEDIGTIKQFDRATGEMVVSRGFPSKQEIVIPLAAADMVDRDERTDYLAIPSADLQRHSVAHAEDE